MKSPIKYNNLSPKGINDNVGFDMQQQSWEEVPLGIQKLAKSGRVKQASASNDPACSVTSSIDVFLHLS
jgi:hypothetical protein